jgi:hypothetical protein
VRVEHSGENDKRLIVSALFMALFIIVIFKKAIAQITTKVFNFLCELCALRA